MERGRMLVLSGPSGCGKSTLCRELLKDQRVEFSVSATTRPKRAGEVDGRDYVFLTPKTFKAHVDAGEFIEWAEVFGNLYGTLRAPMEATLAAGRVYLLEIDVQGALQLKALNVPGTYVFIAPPDFEELRRRLVGRGTESVEVVERRLSKAEDEYRERVKYDHVVINDDLQRALDEVRAIAGLQLGPDTTADRDKE
ncbi:MAG: guanylate kinase [Planctomycetota bacterium]|nr:guanylate kinase [Planctomycetota bacterium]MDP6839326.1 guanylate kinase [Planctomycetota bacterium]MDP6956955.1 guanylate kinase [Planctomycetota bacterium]